MGEELERELNAMGPGEAMFVPCDVTQEEEIKVGSILLPPEVGDTV